MKKLIYILSAVAVLSLTGCGKGFITPVHNSAEPIDEYFIDESRIMRRFDEDPSLLMINGQYGPYLSKEGKNYKLPHNKDLQAISYEECIEIIEAAKNAAPTTARRGRRTKS